MRVTLGTAVLAGTLWASSSAFAAPALMADRYATPQVEQVACWWRNGVRRCNGARAYRHARPYYGSRYYGYGAPYVTYGTPRPEDLPFGSTEWWRAMDREGRGGYRR